MSLTSKAVFSMACATTVGTIFYVHYKQHTDREKLHEGVLKDIERQQMKKQENIYNLQLQNDLTKQLRRQQKEQENS